MARRGFQLPRHAVSSRGFNLSPFSYTAPQAPARLGVGFDRGRERTVPFFLYDLFCYGKVLRSCYANPALWVCVPLWCPFNHFRVRFANFKFRVGIEAPSCRRQSLRGASTTTYWYSTWVHLTAIQVYSPLNGDVKGRGLG